MLFLLFLLLLFLNFFPGHTPQAIARVEICPASPHSTLLLFRCSRSRGWTFNESDGLLQKNVFFPASIKDQESRITSIEDLKDRGSTINNDNNRTKKKRKKKTNTNTKNPKWNNAPVSIVEMATLAQWRMVCIGIKPLIASIALWPSTANPKTIPQPDHDSDDGWPAIVEIGIGLAIGVFDHLETKWHKMINDPQIKDQGSRIQHLRTIKDQGSMIKALTLNQGSRTKDQRYHE